MSVQEIRRWADKDKPSRDLGKEESEKERTKIRSMEDNEIISHAKE